MFYTVTLCCIMYMVVEIWWRYAITSGGSTNVILCYMGAGRWVKELFLALRNLCTAPHLNCLYLVSSCTFISILYDQLCR